MVESVNQFLLPSTSTSSKRITSVITMSMSSSTSKIIYVFPFNCSFIFCPSRRYSVIIILILSQSVSTAHRLTLIRKLQLLLYIASTVVAVMFITVVVLVISFLL